MARSFNGTTDYIDTVTGPSIALGAPFSFSCWCFPTSTSGSPILADEGGSGTNRTFFGINIGVATGFTLFVEGANTNNTAAVPTNTWSQVVGTFDGASSLIYVNGIQQGSSTGSATAANFTKLFIGNGSESGNTFWSGSIAEFGVWNIALSAAAATALASGAVPSLVQPGSLIGYWPLNGVSSPEPDLSGNGNAGVLHGTSIASGPPGIFTSFPLATALTGVPAKAFTKKHYFNEIEKIRSESVAIKEILDAMDDRGRADHDFELARAIADNFDKNMTPSNYAKAMDAKERLESARKNRDHHYFMDVVNRAWAEKK